MPDNVHVVGDPAGGGELRGRRQRPIRDQREQHPLHDRVPPGPGREAAQQGVDPEPVPQPIEQPCPAQRVGLDELQTGNPDHTSPIRACRARLDTDDAGQGGDEALDRGPVELIGATEGVEHLRPRGLRCRVPHVVRQLQIRHLRPVPVPPGRPTHEHATRPYTTTNSSQHQNEHGRVTRDSTVLGQVSPP